MTRETKIGMLVGLGVILLIGIIVSDHLSAVRKQDPAEMIRFAPTAQEGLTSENKTNAQVGATSMDPSANPNAPVPTLPMPTDFNQPAPTPGDPGVTPLGPNSGSRPGQTAMGNSGTGSNSIAALPGSMSNGPIINTTGTTHGVTPLNGGPTPMTAKISEPAKTTTVALATYTVQKGDTLYKISKNFYKDSTKWTLIQEANAAALGSKGKLKDGMVLTIPAIKQAPTEITLARNTISSDPSTSSLKSIEVRPGDTLGALAARSLGSKTKWKDLYEANRDQLRKEQDLKVGMVLRVPATQSSGLSPVTPIVTTAAAPASTGTVRGSTPPVLSLASDHSLAPQTNSLAGVSPVTSGAPVVPTAPVKSTLSTETAVLTTDNKKKVPSNYTVKPGDTLTSIASKTLGNASKWKKIYTANKSEMDSPSDLYAGQVLRIPAA